MRRVKVFTDFKKKKHDYDGWFHGWGTEIIEADQTCQYSVAIVERDDGRVEIPPAEWVQFLDKNFDMGSENNPFCENCKEKPDCVVSTDGTCAMIRRYLEKQ